MVNSITNQYSQVRSEKSTREFFQLFRQEVETFTAEMDAESDDSTDASELSDIVVEEDDR